jgi:hypothetical protein
VALGCYTGLDPFTTLNHSTTVIESCATSGFVVLGQSESQALIDAGLLSNSGLAVDLVNSLAETIPDPSTLAEAWGAGFMIAGVPLVVGLVVGSVLRFIRKP